MKGLGFRVSKQYHWQLRKGYYKDPFLHFLLTTSKEIAGDLKEEKLPKRLGCACLQTRFKEVTLRELLPCNRYITGI